MARPVRFGLFPLAPGKRRALGVPFQRIQRAMRGGEDVAQVRAFCRRACLFASALGVEQLLPAVDEGPAQAADRAHHEQLSHAPIASAGPPKFELFVCGAPDGR